MAGERCTVSQMADVIMEGLEEYAQLAADDMKKAVKKAGTQARKDIQENAPVKTGAYAKSWAAKTTKETANAMEIVVYSRNRYQLAHLLERKPKALSGGQQKSVKQGCAEKRRQDKGVSPYCACGGKGCADSGTGSGEGTEVMAGGESI